MAASNVVESTGVEAAGLAALADPIRLAIVGALVDGQRCVCDLQQRVPVAANLLSYHLRVLREAGLITNARRSRWIDYRLDAEGFVRLWAALAAAGVPLPGDPICVAPIGLSCAEDLP
ncbi:MAG TPA: metalloregulator ArsR/SmtB family transcription factor [Mycobacterium sp.]|nr:metalloregulator ArsR/SmtB family transcription factor [Mycobacterium sp.]